MAENVKGITLNQQLVDLLSIIDDVESIEEQDICINDYISKLAERANGYSNGREGFALKYVISSVCKNIDVAEVIMQVYGEKNNTNRDICNSSNVASALYEKLQNYGMTKEDCEKLNTSILKGLKETDFSAKPGILEMKPEDVRNLYNHMFDKDGKSEYNRITMDTCGRYSDFVAIDGKTFCSGNIDRMMKFARKHDINTKINTFMMYSDFPNIYNDYLSKKIENGEITENECKEELKDSLMKYVIEIGSKYGDKISAVDIFNELIYNPGTAEKKDIFTEYELDENGEKIQIDEDKEGHPIYKEAGFVERSQTGWQKYLDLDDLCEMAVVARTVLPNATFTYNDWNWVIPEKRQAMIDIVNRIQQKQEEIRKNGGIKVNDEIKKTLLEKGISIDENGFLKFNENQTIIDNIGLEAHLCTETEPEQLEETVDDITKQTGLSCEVTEEDVAYEKNVEGNKNLAKIMQEKQKRLFSKIEELVAKGKLIGSTIWSLGKSSFTDKMYRYITHASVLDENYNSKLNEKQKTTLEEIDNDNQQGVFKPDALETSFTNLEENRRLSGFQKQTQVVKTLPEEKTVQVNKELD